MPRTEQGGDERHARRLRGGAVGVQVVEICVHPRFRFACVHRGVTVVGDALRTARFHEIRIQLSDLAAGHAHKIDVVFRPPHRIEIDEGGNGRMFPDYTDRLFREGQRVLVWLVANKKCSRRGMGSKFRNRTEHGFFVFFFTHLHKAVTVDAVVV